MQSLYYKGGMLGGKRMNNTGSLAEVIVKKQELAEKEEELTRKAIEDSISTRLKENIKWVSNDRFLESLRGNEYTYICIRMPKFENRFTIVGKMYTEAVNKIIRQQNETNPNCQLEIENDKITINYVIRTRKNKDCVGNFMNTFVIRVTGKETAEERVK